MPFAAHSNPRITGSRPGKSSSIISADALIKLERPFTSASMDLTLLVLEESFLNMKNCARVNRNQKALRKTNGQNMTLLGFWKGSHMQSTVAIIMSISFWMKTRQRILCLNMNWPVLREKLGKPKRSNRMLIMLCFKLDKVNRNRKIESFVRRKKTSNQKKRLTTIVQLIPIQSGRNTQHLACRTSVTCTSDTPTLW